MDTFNHALKQLPRVVELPPEQQGAFIWNLGPQLFGTRSWGPKPNRVVNAIAKLLDDPKFTARALAIRLLAEVVTGNHRTVIDYGLDLEDPVLAKRFDDPDPQAAYKAALKLAPKLSAELSADEPATRSAAAFALAFLPGAAGKTAEHLRKRLDAEEDPLVTNSLLVALGLSCRYAKLPWEVPEPSSDAAIEQRAAWCCAQAYAVPRGEDTTPEAQRASALFTELTSRPWCEEERFPFDEGHLDCLLARAVARSGPPALEIMTNALADAVARLGKSQEAPQRATAWTMTALNLLWRQAEDLPRGPAELTPLQRGVLEKLSEHDTPAPFHGFGLPARCWERRRWLGLVPTTAFDMEVEDEDGRSRSVRELLARWNAGGPQRRKQAYEYLRERLTLQQFAEVLGEAAFGAGSLGSPPDDAYYACLDALSAKDADWAERYAVQLWGRLDCDTSVPERQRIVARSSLLVLKPIVAGLADDASLPDKWARLVRLGSHRGVELTRQLLDRLPPDQREQLFSSHLDDQEGWSVALLLLSPYLDFFPSIALIERFLELTSLAVKDEDRRRARTAVEALQGLAKSNHPLAGEVAQRLEAWRKARKTALKKMDL